ncbi:MAG TPA: GntR family transcriptional regulator [Rhodopila sp.]|jgi:DNA-binding GntR family transcriptional regulator|nr:GntR family transcriptional regulator [Rhodopila sp.]
MLLRDRVYQAIRGAILTCEFQPGLELREQILAERYRVSRSPIRDSLLRLEHEKLVTVLPRQGYRVNPISLADVEDIFGLRLVIEPACAAAAARADEEAVRALGRFRDFARDERTGAEFIEYNKSFHRSLMGLSGNARMAAIAVDLDEQFQRLALLTVNAVTEENVRYACAEHDAIIEAVQAHDADRAAKLSYEHAAQAHARIWPAIRTVAQGWEEAAETAATTG